MWFFGKSRGDDLIAKVKALQHQNCASNKDCLAQLYSFLTILDTKATGMLTVDTLFIALLAFLASPEAFSKFLNVPYPRLVIEIQLILASLSAFLCLLVVRVSWKFLAEVPTTPTSPGHFEVELKRLANVLDDRTLYYWFAWLLALATFVLTLAWWSWWCAICAGIVIILWSKARG